MPLRVATASIALTRDGKTYYPTIGKAEQFSTEEIAQVAALEKAHKKTFLRKPTNESAGLEEKADDTEPLNLDKATIAQLKTYAQTKGIDLGDATTKEDIRTKINAAESDI